MTLINELSGRFGVEPILRVLQIASSTYYGWLQRETEPSMREQEDRGLLSHIFEIWDNSGATYGSPRVHQILKRREIYVSRKRVERLMREHDMQGAFLRRGWKGGSTKQNPRHDPAPDLVNRDFTAPAPNRLWVADATRITTGEGILWLAAVRDAFSNRIVGWKTSHRCDTDLVLGALEYATWSRDIQDGQLIHHSDRGSTYTSFRFSQRLADNGIAASMGSVGDSYDNALMENFFSTLKTELVYRSTWRTRDEADNALFAYIDAWYNTERIQLRLGWLSPAEYETAWLNQNQPIPTPA